MKDWRYKHLHRCSECGAERSCVESDHIGEGGGQPPSGFVETCAACKEKNKELYAAIIARVDHLNI